jgi:hypothetical protein
MYKNWIARYYNKNNKVIHTEKFSNRTEHEAENEAGSLIPIKCTDWTLVPIIEKSKLKLSIDPESVDIYVDNGEDEEPISVVYWYIDEVKEDADVAISMCNAIDLFYRDTKELFNRIYGEVELID